MSLSVGLFLLARVGFPLGPMTGLASVWDLLMMSDKHFILGNYTCILTKQGWFLL